MKIILPVITAIIAGVLVFLLGQSNQKEQIQKSNLSELKTVQSSVQKRLNEYYEQISSELQAFAHSVESDRNFQLRLLAENDRSNSDVTDIAGRFSAPMGFSVLDVTDSAFIILSSGHFPASAGNSISEKAGRLGDTPFCFDDNLMGVNTLTLQAKKEFKIMDMPFYVMGGMKIDEKFLLSLSPYSGVKVLLKRGSEYSGNSGIHSISGIKGTTILINDKECLAAEIALPYSGNDDKPVLIVILEK